MINLMISCFDNILLTIESLLKQRIINLIYKNIFRLSIIPRKTNAQKNQSTTNFLTKPIGLENQTLSNCNNELVIWENNNGTNNEKLKSSTRNRHSNQVNKELLRQIESIDPDYEQRKLAIEVKNSNIFLKIYGNSINEFTLIEF
jgi:hypothetical protein